MTTAPATPCFATIFNTASADTDANQQIQARKNQTLEAAKAFLADDLTAPPLALLCRRLKQQAGQFTVDTSIARDQLDWAHSVLSGAMIINQAHASVHVLDALATAEVFAMYTAEIVKDDLLEIIDQEKDSMRRGAVDFLNRTMLLLEACPQIFKDAESEKNTLRLIDIYIEEKGYDATAASLRADAMHGHRLPALQTIETAYIWLQSSMLHEMELDAAYYAMTVGKGTHKQTRLRGQLKKYIHDGIDAIEQMDLTRTVLLKSLSADASPQPRTANTAKPNTKRLH